MTSMTSPGDTPAPDGPSSARPRRRRFDTPEQEVYLNLWRTYDRLRSIEEEVFGRYEITAQQYNALRLLRAARPAKLPTLALAGRLISRAPDITRLLTKLQDRGLIDRDRPSENRRIVHVGITEAGLTLLIELDEQVRDCSRRQLGHLGAERLAALLELLRHARQPHEPTDSDW